MSNKNMLPKIVGGAIIVGGLYMVYMYAKKNLFKGKKESKVGSIPEKPQPQNTSGSTGFSQPSLALPSNSNGNYIVKITSGVLNVRQSANTTSKIVGTFKKGDVIKASESSTKGWHRVLDKNLKLLGYVSSTYIGAK
jgi:hypothetical protein